MAIPSTWARVRHRWQAWRAWLRRERSVAALAVMLALGVGEPLLCVAHCQIWLPIAFRSHFSAQPQHHHHAEAGALPSPAAAPKHAGTCVLAKGAGVPFHVPPSPVHDMLATLVAALIVFQLLFTFMPSPPGEAPTAPRPALLRPPIARAA